VRSAVRFRTSGTQVSGGSFGSFGSVPLLSRARLYGELCLKPETPETRYRPRDERRMRR